MFPELLVSACADRDTTAEFPEPTPQKIEVMPEGTYPLHEYAEHSYFAIDREHPLPCFHPQPKNRLTTRNLPYESPAMYCASSDNGDSVSYEFACTVPDCREEFDGSFRCPDVTVMNCAAFYCVANRSQAAQEE